MQTLKFQLHLFEFLMKLSKIEIIEKLKLLCIILEKNKS